MSKKRTKPALRWHNVKTDQGYCATYYLGPEAISTAALARMWSLHTDGVATTVTLRKVRGVLQAAALVQVVTPQPPTQPPALNLHTLPGDQLAALGWSAPSARMRLAVPFAALDGELRLPIGPCGVLIGAMMRDDPATGARRDDFVTLPLTDPVETTRIAMDVTPEYAGAVLMRAAAVGERIIIHTNSPDMWTGLADPNIAIARGGRAPFVPTIVVNDHAVNVPAQGLASTMITFGEALDADIEFVQVDEDTVRVATGGRAVNVRVIRFLREKGWTG